MNRVIDELVESALRELADEAYQRGLWTAGSGPEISSLSECMCQLFDDSGLGDALEAGLVYSADIDRRLRALGDLLGRIDERAAPAETLDDPHLAQARAVASELLHDLRRFAADEGDTGNMPTTRAGQDRQHWGFATVARTAFEFLEREHEMKIMRVEATFVRYQGERRFVNVFHGRASYELGVEIGRWVTLGDRVVEQRFALQEVVALHNDPGATGFRSLTATSADQIARFLPRLAAWTREYAVPALSDDDGVFAADE